MTLIRRALFIVPGERQSGACGVVDYSLRLAQAAAAEGTEILLFPLYPAGQTETEFLSALPESLKKWIKLINPEERNLSARIRKISEVAGEFRPDLVNIQFYPKLFKTGRRYLPALKELAQSLGNWPRVVTLHETWTKLGDPSGLAGWWKGRIRVHDLIKGFKYLRPEMMFVSNDAHRCEVESAGFRAELLPIISNIDRHPLPEGITDLTDLLPGLASPVIADVPHNALVAILFARIIPQWDAEKVVKSFLLESQKCNRPPIIISVGETGYADAGWQRLVQAAEGITCLKLGRRTEREISWLLQVADWGFSPTPSAYWTKSGSCAAMIVHGLPLVFTEFENSEEIPPSCYVSLENGFQKCVLPIPFSQIASSKEIWRILLGKLN